MGYHGKVGAHVNVEVGKNTWVSQVPFIAGGIGLLGSSPGALYMEKRVPPSSIQVCQEPPPPRAVPHREVFRS